MVRLKHVTTGVVVNVSDEKAGRLSREWQPVQPETKKSTPSRRRQHKSD